MNITKGMGRSCRAAMRKIADGAHPTKVIEHGFDANDGHSACTALHELGWMERMTDYFHYGRELDGWPTYRAEEVLMALALCVTLAESRHPKNC